MNLQDMVMNSIKNIEAEGFVEKQIDDHVRKAISEVIKDSYGSWSPFSKQLKEYIQENIKIDLRETKLPEYNQLVLNAVKERLEGIICNEGIEQMKKDISELLVGADKVWKLSELIAKMKEDSEDEAREEDWSEISLNVRKDNSYGSDWCYLSFDPAPDKSEYSCKYRISLHNGTVYSIKVEDCDFQTKFFAGKLYGLERELFMMYSKKAKIEIDQNVIDTYYSDDDC